MQYTPSPIAGAWILDITPIPDARGFFAMTWLPDELRQRGMNSSLAQCNLAFNHKRGTLRGMHFQTDPGQAKLVRCARGQILDVVVDLRRDSDTFGRWDGHELDDANLRQLWVPVGFAHGFCVLSEEADVVYKCSSYYDPATEAGIAYDDPDVGIAWPDLELLVSERDRSAPRLADVAESLTFLNEKA